jgi:hypothetical protein
MQFVSRRKLAGNCALTAFAVLQNANRTVAQNSRRPVQAAGAALIDHPRGQFSFLPGIPAYSSGVVARKGYEIVHATFSRLPSVHAGFKAIEDHLSGLKLPKTALCAVELRIPQALTLEDFSKFNNSYVEVLKSWGIVLENGLNPVARTNVAPVAFPPSEPSFHAFSYSIPSTIPQKTFIVAGGGEIGDLGKYPGDIVGRGDTSPAGIARKVRYVMALMEGRLRGMHADWPEVTAIDVYTAHDLGGAIVTELLKASGHNAFIWNYSRPPIKELDFEMDLRGVRHEIVLG